MIKFDHFAERGPLRKIRERLNDMHEQIRSLRIANGKGYTVKRTAIGQILNIAAVGKSVETGGMRIAWVAINTISDAELSASIDGEYQIISRPEGTWADGWDYEGSALTEWRRNHLLLQSASGTTSSVASSAEGQVRTYDVTLRNPESGADETTKITERLMPRYTVGDIIAVVNDPEENGTGRSGVFGGAWHWVDLNIDARQWVVWPVISAVCINGETKYVYVMRSEYSGE